MKTYACPRTSRQWWYSRQQGSRKCGCSWCSCTYTFFRKGVFRPQKSVKPLGYLGMSPETDRIWFFAPTTFKLSNDPCNFDHSWIFFNLLMLFIDPIEGMFQLPDVALVTSRKGYILMLKLPISFFCTLFCHQKIIAWLWMYKK